MRGPLVVPRRPWHRLAAVAALVALGAGQAGSVAPRPQGDLPGGWRVGQPVPVAVSAGRAVFRAPTPTAGSRTLVIVSALGRAGGPFPISLKARGAGRAELPTLANDGPRRPSRLFAQTLPPVGPPTANVPPPVRDFHVMVRDGDVASASNYLAVRGELRALGRRVQVYVDAQDGGRVGEPMLRDLVETFDESVFPLAARTFGQARDVDGDGRFTVLITGWLTRLAGGRHAVDGFVRGADLDPALAAPFSNHCDMMYLSTAVGAGPHLRTLLAHEYTHAVSFQARASADGADRPARDEEDWLDEALAHLVEDLHGFSRSNLDYRVSAFLSRPERYRLVVEDYYAADLFRSHGNRGGTYLFLRWCADRFGPELLPALIRSRRRGVANLETATGQTFAELYRGWSTALFLTGLAPDQAADGGFRSVDVRRPLQDWELAGPNTVHLDPGGPPETWSAAGTSSHFVVVGASPKGAVEVEVEGPAAAELQVTAVPLPPEMADLRLVARVAEGSDGELRLAATLRHRHGTPVELSAVAWEPLVPAIDPHSAGFRHGGLNRRALARAFGGTVLAAGEVLASSDIRLAGVRDEHLPLVVKAVGTDARGNRVCAWAELPEPGEGEATDDGDEP